MNSQNLNNHTRQMAIYCLSLESHRFVILAMWRWTDGYELVIGGSRLFAGVTVDFTTDIQTIFTEKQVLCLRFKLGDLEN